MMRNLLALISFQRLKEGYEGIWFAMPERTITKLFQKWDYGKNPKEIFQGVGGEGGFSKYWKLVNLSV